MARTATMLSVFLAMAMAADTPTNTAEMSSSRTTTVVNNNTVVVDFTWNVNSANTRGFTAASGTYLPWTCNPTNTFVTIIQESTLTRAACGRDLATLASAVPTACSNAFMLYGGGGSSACLRSCASATLKDDISATSSIIAVGCDSPIIAYRNIPASVEASMTSSPGMVPTSVALSPTMTATDISGSTSSTSAATAISSASQDSGQKGGLSKDGIMGLGVGIGVGVPTVLLAFLAWRYPRRPASERWRAARVLRSSSAPAVYRKRLSEH